MSVWIEFCQEMFACFEERELALFLPAGLLSGKGSETLRGGKVRTERVAQLQPHTLLGCHGAYEGQRCLSPLACLFTLQGETAISFAE